MMNLETDRQISQLHQNGKREEAFELFVRKYKPSLYSLCYRMMQNAEDAAEAWQEILLQVEHSLRNFKNESSLYTWAYRIALNVCTNLRRRLSREATYAAIDLAEIENLPIEGAIYNPEAVCQISFKKYIVKKALNRLPDTQKTVLILHNLEGFTLKEIAATLGIKENAAKARLRRAMSAFRELLDKDYENVGVKLDNVSSIACTSKLN
jgi:RNA polymerase sigma-70 factor (ECF subfamily)